MKKRLFLKIGLVLIISLFIFEAKAQICDLDVLKPIAYGQRDTLKDKSVSIAQACLIEAGYDIPAGPTGFYGPQTASAIRQFYLDWYGNWSGRSLDKRGINMLKLVLAEKLSPSCDPDALVVVSYGEAGLEVRNLQLCLIEAGYKIPSRVIGYYGPQTLQAVKEFYRSWYGSWHGKHIGPRGIEELRIRLGKITVDICDPYNLAPVKFGQRGSAVKNLQLCLIEAGYNIPSGATGFYDDETRNAVINFYADWYGRWSGLAVDIKGVEKLKEMFLE